MSPNSKQTNPSDPLNLSFVQTETRTLGADQVKIGRSRPFQLWTKEDAIDRFRFNVWRTKGTMEMDVKKEEWSFEVFGYEVSET